MVLEDIRRNLPLVGYQAVGKVVRELGDYIDRKTGKEAESFFKRYGTYIKLGVGIGGLILPSIMRGASPEMRFAGAIVGSNVLAEVIVDGILSAVTRGTAPSLAVTPTVPTIKVPTRKAGLEVA